MQTKTSRSFLSNPSVSHPFVTSWFTFGFRLFSILRKLWWQASELTVTQTLLPRRQYLLLLSNNTSLWVKSNDENKALKCNKRLHTSLVRLYHDLVPCPVCSSFCHLAFWSLSLTNKATNMNNKQSWKWFNSRWNPIGFVYTFCLINICLSLSDGANKIKTLNIESAKQFKFSLKIWVQFIEWFRRNALLKTRNFKGDVRLINFFTTQQFRSFWYLIFPSILLAKSWKLHKLLNLISSFNSCI